MARLVCLGVIVGAHGVRGLVRVKSFTEDPEAIAAYGPLTDAAGRRSFTLSLRGESRGALLAAIEGVADRDAAQALKGVELHVPRARLPEPDEAEAFYAADLVGLPAYGPDGGQLGTVRGLADFGAGDVMEVTATDGRALTLPFTEAAVPEIAVAAGYVVIEPAESMEAAGDGPDETESDDGP